MARTSAIMFAAGAVLVALTTLTPGWPDLHATALRIVALPALCAAVVLEVFGRRLPLWSFHLFALLGTAFVTVAVLLAGGGPAALSYALMYVWVALFVFSFFSVPVASAHCLLVGGLGGVVLWSSDPVGASGSIAALWVTLAMVGGVSGWLVRKVRRLAQTDELTGLPNRRAFEAALAREAARAAREHKPLAVALIDLDHFKALNDRFGHEAGDRMLRDTAIAWSADLRPSDLLARHGGDEFGLILPGCSMTRAREVLERIRAATPRDQTCSAGAAFWDGEESIYRVLERADRSLYEAKGTGRDRSVLGAGGYGAGWTATLL
jgi:diguanylate cyclase (GGDEF)-like protein